MKNDNWFSAHKDGLRQIAERLVERRGFGIIGGELYQNVMDTTAKNCQIHLEMIEGRPAAHLHVQDDGPGYKDLTHAWTVFAPSEKKDDPSKAGRFNVGCKMALAFCRNATIYTTSGTVEFGGEGRKEFPRRKRIIGTEVFAVIDCTRERYDQFIEYMNKLIVRPGLKLSVNGVDIPNKTPIHRFEIALQTEVGEQLKKSIRKTFVEIYEVADGETAMLHELGIPIVETGDKWSYNVLQKVPLNVDRDNVTPAYLRDLRTAVFNEMHSRIEEEDTNATWVQEASSDADCKPDALETFLNKKYGEKRVSFDPTNPDANAEALVGGYTIIPARGLSEGQRKNAKEAGLLYSSSVAFPRAGKGAYSDTGKPVEVIPQEKWTVGMKIVYDYSRSLSWKLLDEPLEVRFVNCKSFVGKRWAACFGNGAGCQLDFNIWVLGKEYFSKGITDSLNALLIHEFAHNFSPNHADDDFHDACCKLGAKMTELALKNPKFFKDFDKRFEKVCL